MVDRHQFYLSVCESFLTGKLHVSDRQLTAEIASLIGHVEMRDSDHVTRQQPYIDWLPINTQWHTDSDLITLINAQLTKLSGMSKAAAEYRLIQTVDTLPMYGACYHTARNSAGVSVNIAATSSATVFFSENWKQLNRSEINVFSCCVLLMRKVAVSVIGCWLVFSAALTDVVRVRYCVCC